MGVATINQLVTNYKLDKPEIKLLFCDEGRKSEINFKEKFGTLEDNVKAFILKNLNPYSVSEIKFSTFHYNNFHNLYSTGHKVIINSDKINNIRFLNKYFEFVNLKLSEDGLFFGCVETYATRNERFRIKYPRPLSKLFAIVDFFLNRLFPKLLVTKKIYFYLTKGRSRALSRAETYGRLYSCGFEVIDESNFNNLHYFVAKKSTKPKFDLNPTYGPFISLKRIGKNKELFKVYKVRTMHPYSEYLQDYVYKRNDLQEGGKFKDDFRISPLGRILRKFWIDEIPMLYNVLKGDMKLVGVRPLSQHYFSLYPKDVQDLRTKFKPGFIPPFYADNPKTLEEIIASEKKYLLAYQRNSIKTDFNYLVKSLNNVFFGGLRSF